MVYMKRNLIYGSVLSMAAMSFLLSSCSEDKDGLESLEEKSFVHLTATIDEIGSDLRAAWHIQGLQTEKPDYTTPELFKWSNGDEMVSLFSGKKTSEVQYNLPISTDGDEATKVDLNLELPKNGKLWLFYPSSTIENVVEESGDVENAQVSLTIDATQSVENQKKFAFLRTDEITLENGVASPDNIKFNHLTSLLRFHVWNASGRNYVVKEIKIASSAPTVFLKTGNYKLASKDFEVQKDINNSTFADALIWSNVNYRTDDALVDDAGTTLREDIYDALLVTFPVDPDQLDGVELTVSVTLADKDNNYAEFTPNPLVLNNTNSATVFSKGFVRGTRTYINMKVSGSNTLELVDDIAYPGGWGNHDEEDDVTEE